MMACAIKIESEFSDAQVKFENIIEWLSGKESHKLTHGEVETQLKEEGRELLRLLYQTHLDARGLVDIGDRLESQDGTIRTHRRETHRNLKTIFGGVLVNRQSYGAVGAESLHPKDAQLTCPSTSIRIQYARLQQGKLPGHHSMKPCRQLTNTPEFMWRSSKSEDWLKKQLLTSMIFMRCEILGFSYQARVSEEL